MTEQVETTAPQGPQTESSNLTTPQAFPQAQTAMPQQVMVVPQKAVSEDQLSTIGRRIGAWFLEGLLAVVTLGIGWLIWAAITAAKGQTPAKKVLKMQAVDRKTGEPLSWASYVLVRGLVGYTVQSFAGLVTIGIAHLWPLWDDDNQSIAEKVSNSVTVDIG